MLNRQLFPKNMTKREGPTSTMAPFKMASAKILKELEENKRREFYHNSHDSESDFNWDILWFVLLIAGIVVVILLILALGCLCYRFRMCLYECWRVLRTLVSGVIYTAARVESSRTGDTSRPSPDCQSDSDTTVLQPLMSADVCDVTDVCDQQLSVESGLNQTLGEGKDSSKVVDLCPVKMSVEKFNSRTGSEEQSGAKSGNKTEAESGDETGETTGAESRDESGETTGAESGDETGETTGDESGTECVDISGAEFGDETGAETNAESGVPVRASGMLSVSFADLRSRENDNSDEEAVL